MKWKIDIQGRPEKRPKRTITSGHPGCASTTFCASCSEGSGARSVGRGQIRVQASARAAERDPAREMVKSDLAALVGFAGGRHIVAWNAAIVSSASRIRTSARSDNPGLCSTSFRKALPIFTARRRSSIGIILQPYRWRRTLSVRSARQRGHKYGRGRRRSTRSSCRRKLSAHATSATSRGVLGRRLDRFDLDARLDRLDRS